MPYYVFVCHDYKHHCELVVKMNVRDDDKHVTWLNRFFVMLRNFHYPAFGGEPFSYYKILNPSKWYEKKRTNAASLYADMEEGYRANFKDLQATITTPTLLLEKYPNLIHLKEEIMENFDFNCEMPILCHLMDELDKNYPDEFYFVQDLDFHNLTCYISYMCRDIDRFRQLIKKYF